MWNRCARSLLERALAFTVSSRGEFDGASFSEGAARTARAEAAREDEDGDEDETRDEVIEGMY